MGCEPEQPPLDELDIDGPERSGRLDSLTTSTFYKYKVQGLPDLIGRVQAQTRRN